MTFEVEQSKRDLELATQYETECLANLAKREVGPNPTGFSAPRRFFKGYRGEFAVRDWLADRRLAFQYNVNTSGHSMKSEFLGQYGGKPVYLEVKCSGKASHTEALITKGQRLDWQILVVPHLVGGPDDPRCVVLGWLGIKDLAKRCTTQTLPHAGGGTRENYVCKFADLRELHTLPEVLLRAQTHDEWVADYERESDDANSATPAR